MPLQLMCAHDGENYLSFWGCQQTLSDLVRAS